LVIHHHQHWLTMFVLVFIAFARDSVLIEYGTIGEVSGGCQGFFKFFFDVMGRRGPYLIHKK